MIPRAHVRRTCAPRVRWPFARAAVLALAIGAVGTTDASGRLDPTETPRQEISVSFLTYNTHGLPAWIARDDPAARFPRLLEKAERFDVVLLQEDFAHQELVDEEHRHAALVRGNGPRLRWPGFGGSGLTLLTHLEIVEDAVRTPYESCHGWLGAASDCLGNKGFLMQRLALPNGAAMDVWNTHLEAGGGEPDHAIRREQLELLAHAIESHSDGRAIVVGGDFNFDWNDERDRGILEAWLTRLGLALAAMTPAGTWGSRLDYLFFRAGAGVQVVRTDGGMLCDFIGLRGEPLSDHPAIFATFDVR